MFHLQTSKKILKSKQKEYVAGSRSVPRAFLGILGPCAGTRTLILEGAPSDRQTNKSYGST